MRTIRLLSIGIIFFGVSSNTVLADERMIPNDPGFTQQWYLRQIKAPEAWARGRVLRGSLGQGSADVVVAIIDSGVDITHPDLEGNIWTNPKEIPQNGLDDDRNGFVDDVHGWDFLTNTNNPKPKIDQNADLEQSPLGIHHGTIIAGLTAAVGDNSEGLAGVVWRASLMPLRVIHSDGTGEATVVARAMDYAIANGAHIINLSFVGDTNTSTLANAVLRAERAGVLVVAAAGNEARGNGVVQVYDLDATPLYPICHDGLNNAVIGVTATDNADHKSTFASFGSRCIDVSSPGQHLIVTRATDPAFGVVRPYGSPVEGTSMSTALVSGSAALLKSLFPIAPMKRIGEVLISSSDPIDDRNDEYRGRIGHGRINLDEAVKVFDREYPSTPVPKLPTPVEPLVSASSKRSPQPILIAERFVSPGVVNVIRMSHDGVVQRSTTIRTEWKTLPSAAVLSTGEIVLGAPRGHEPWVRLYDENGTLLRSRLVYPRPMTGGISVQNVFGAGQSNSIAVFPIHNAGGQLLFINRDLQDQRQQFVADPRVRADWVMGPSMTSRHELGVMIVGSHDPDKAIIVTPDGSIREQPLPKSARHEPWSSATTLAAVYNGSGTVMVARGFRDRSQIQIRDSIFNAYRSVFNLGVSVAAFMTDTMQTTVAVLPMGGPGHLRFFSADSKALNQRMISDPNVRAAWRIAFALIQMP